MRLITWNCQGAYRKKAEFILSYQPDILVIQECEHPDKLLYSPKAKTPCDILWFGENKHKGLGIFSYSNFKFELIDYYNPDFKFVIPISVTNPHFSFTLLAIWANNNLDKNNQYIEQVWKAINYYDLLLNNKNIILIGDFNSNKIWDRKHRIGNHSDVVAKLAGKNIFSCYHNYFDQEQGNETVPTFYLHRNKNKAYHLDYCFVSSDIYEKFTGMEIGSFDNWIVHSDHSPVIVNFG